MAIPDAGSDAAQEQLRRIEAVTDTAMADLDVEDLLDELLERTREILSVDTAAVLLLDASATHLVAAAARGIEEEVRQGVRIPLGKGFAGRIAARRTAVILDHVDHTTVLNPILQDKGIRSLLGVPLLAGGGAVLGVLHVGSVSDRRFTDRDATLLQLVAECMALATQSRLARAERSAALLLQRSLLPAQLPDVQGLEFAARYVPAGDREIGGDWYDVFGLPSGWMCLVVGDVMGRGLRAAIAMGRLRDAVRSYALESVDPAELLSKIDRQVKYFDDDVMATAQCALVEPSLEGLLLSSAGHPPPLSVQPGQPAVYLDPPADLPLGVDTHYPRHTTRVPLEPGTRLCFYTDGLVERRSTSIDTGLERLRRSAYAAPAEAMCAAVMSALLGADAAPDDVALLVLHRLDPHTR
jgi:phosphoserine phosphatase RsbU/P